MKINSQSFCRACFLIPMLMVIGILAYAQTLFYPFVHDDVEFIQKNPTIQTLHTKEIFLRPNDAPAKGLINFYYRPILDVVYRLQYQLFKFNPSGYHLINILLHISNAVIILFLFRNIFKNSSLAFAAALVFLIHPVQTEAVACIVGISNLLYVFFLLLSLLMYQKRGEKGNYVISLVFFLTALLTKEQAVMLPVLLILCELMVRKSSWPESLKAVSGHICILLFYLFFRKTVLGIAGVDLGPWEELKLRIMSIPSTLLMYLRLMIAPYGLHYYRSTDILLPVLKPVLGLSGLGVLTFLAVRSFKADEKKMFLFGSGWFLITLLPTLNILPLVNEYSLILTSEHFLYLPVVGVVMMAAAGFEHLRTKVNVLNHPAVLIGLSFFLTVGYFSLTVQQNTYWRSEVALFERMMTYEKNFARGHLLLARAYYFDHQFLKAAEHYEKASKRMNYYRDQVSNLKVKGFYEGFLKEIYFESAHLNQILGNGEKTILYYTKLIELDPNFSKAYINLGVYYVMNGKVDQALENFNHAAAINPYDPIAWQNLLMIYKQQGDRQNTLKAVQMLKRIHE